VCVCVCVRVCVRACVCFVYMFLGGKLGCALFVCLCLCVSRETCLPSLLNPLLAATQQPSPPQRRARLLQWRPARSKSQRSSRASRWKRGLQSGWGEEDVSGCSSLLAQPPHARVCALGPAVACFVPKRT